MEEKHFFLPYADSEEQAERVYTSIKEHLVSIGRPTTDDRIYAVNYTHDGEVFTDKVGELSNIAKEIVVAIFVASPSLCYICTQNAGVVKGAPITVRTNYIVYFPKWT